MGAFVRILASVKTALEMRTLVNSEPQVEASVAAPTLIEPSAAQIQVPIARVTHRAELLSSFARELEAIGGVFAGSVSPGELPTRSVAIADQLGALIIAVGEGVTHDLLPIANLLEQHHRDLILFGAAGDDEARRAALARIARADLGIVEAHCAIAASGTVAVVASPARPNALTLMPPAVLVIVPADRIFPDLASAIEQLGPDLIAGRRTVFITGPSRTADIEKRIVIGVHGPRNLHVLALWPTDV
ncbi:MAG: lactate utilization protein [Candidatus Binataceae bacterium]|nr:lactate utilization protein [Candidatus Binataceae bacterium]